MLSRDQRVPKNLFPLLKKNTLYEGEVFGLRVTREHLGLVLNKSKCICIVSKKVAKKAVDRNRIRRVVYSIIKEYLVTEEKKMVIQIFPKKIATEIDFQTQRQELLKILKSIK